MFCNESRPGARDTQARALDAVATEDRIMAQQRPEVTAPRFNLGDHVKIRHTKDWHGRIVELRGPLAPGGVQVYRVLVRRKPMRKYIELREDQLILIPPES